MTLPSIAFGTNKKHDDDPEEQVVIEANVLNGDEQFGGHEARKRLEKKLLRKLDLRVSILIIIYILNYVRTLDLGYCESPSKLWDDRLIETMRRECSRCEIEYQYVLLNFIALRDCVASKPICISKARISTRS